MIIKPYGKFKIKWLNKGGDIKNCDFCWFGQTNNGIHHCPEIKCVVKGKARVFVKEN